MTGCKQIDGSKFVFCLNMWFESEGEYCSVFMKSIACEIKNLSSWTGRELHIVLLINLAFSLKPMIWVVLSNVLKGTSVKNCELRWQSLFHVSNERLPICISSNMW